MNIEIYSMILSIEDILEEPIPPCIIELIELAYNKGYVKGCSDTTLEIKKALNL